MPSGADQAAVAVRPMTFTLEVSGSNTILLLSSSAAAAAAAEAAAAQ